MVIADRLVVMHAVGTVKNVNYIAEEIRSLLKFLIIFRAFLIGGNDYVRRNDR
jgi:hypothetical protein